MGLAGEATAAGAAVAELEDAVVAGEGAVVVAAEEAEEAVVVAAEEEGVALAVAAGVAEVVVSPTFSVVFFSPGRLRAGLTGSGRLSSALDFPQAAPGIVPAVFGRAPPDLSQKKVEAFSGTGKGAAEDSAGVGVADTAVAVAGGAEEATARGAGAAAGAVLAATEGAGEAAGAIATGTGRGAGTPQPFGALLTAAVALGGAAATAALGGAATAGVGAAGCAACAGCSGAAVGWAC